MNGCLVIISGPSAVGKTSVATEILKRHANLFERVITCTTRAPRGTEKHGVDYIFMSEQEFLEKKSNNEFLEDSRVYSNYYGVLKKTVDDIILKNKDALLVMNWEGYLKIKNKINQKVVGIFLLPPSIKTLEERIRNRGDDSEDEIQKRLKMNEEDMIYASYFDYQIVNHQINDTVNQILQLVDNIKEK